MTDFNLLRHQGTMMGEGASMELFRLSFDLISKYLNISVTFSTLIAWPGSWRLYFLSDIVSLSQIMVRDDLSPGKLLSRKLCFWENCFLMFAFEIDDFLYIWLLDYYLFVHLLHLWKIQAFKYGFGLQELFIFIELWSNYNFYLNEFPA